MSAVLIADGEWRVYFNRHGAVEMPWCVAPEAGGWEIAVAGFSADSLWKTVYQPKATHDDEDGRPSAWIAVAGRLEILETGHARITDR